MEDDLAAMMDTEVVWMTWLINKVDKFGAGQNDRELSVK